MSDYSDKLPVGTKVQAVWSNDGEWYVILVEIFIFSIVFSLFIFLPMLFFSIFDIVEHSGTMLLLRHIHLMGI